MIHLLLHLRTYFVGLVLNKLSQNKLICLYILSVDVVEWSQNIGFSPR